jgi:hypothetical protein
VVELIVSEDKGFQLIDRGPFRRLLAYLRPSLSDKDIPHRTALRKEILLRAEVAEAKVKAALQVSLFICSLLADLNHMARTLKA